MRPRREHDRLWPVLSVLVALLSTTVSVEIYASGRAAPAKVIEIHGASETISLDANGEVEEGGDLAPDPHAPIDARHAEARQLARRGAIDEALAIFAELAAAHPDEPSVHNDHGYWLLVADRYDEARVEFERALALSPNDATIELNLGTVHLRMGQPSQAERRYTRALSLRASYGRARIALATLLLERRDLAGAERVIRPAAESGSNTERARALRILGQAELGLGRRDDAERDFARAIERAPAEPELRLRIAEAYMRTHAPGDVDRAIAVLNEATSIAPDVASIQYAIGRAFERAGDGTAAERAYKRALSLDPGHHYARRRLLRRALERRDFAEARAHAEHLLVEDDRNPEHHFLAGLVASRDERPDDARRFYARALERRGGTYPEAWLNLGRLEKGEGALDAAIEAYRKAIEQRPDYLAAWNNLGLALAAAGRTEEAEAAYRKAIAIDGEYPAAWVNLGILIASTGRVDQGVEALERAIRLRGGRYPQAQLDLGLVYSRAGRRADAIRTFEQLTEQQPRYARAFENLGDVLRAAGRRQEAEAAYERALELDEESLTARLALGEILVSRGATAEGAAAFRDVLDRDPHHGAARLALGELHRREGRSADCAREARLVLSDAPTNEDARQLLGACSSDTRAHGVPRL